MWCVPAYTYTHTHTFFLNAKKKKKKENEKSIRSSRASARAPLWRDEAEMRSFDACARAFATITNGNQRRRWRRRLCVDVRGFCMNSFWARTTSLAFGPHTRHKQTRAHQHATCEMLAHPFSRDHETELSIASFYSFISFFLFIHKWQRSFLASVDSLGFCFSTVSDDNDDASVLYYHSAELHHRCAIVNARA